MPTPPVNLDAHIKREDFLVETDQSSDTPKGGHFKLSELEGNGIVFQMLRKPDFQRETASWTPEKIAELIRTFVDGELISSIIMWRSPQSGNLFVIDGTHRLSALIAWVHDDYGDSQLSMPFFGNSIPAAQKKTTGVVRGIVNSRIGKYEDMKHILHNRQGASTNENPPLLKRAKNTGVLPIELQWVSGDGEKAEASFFAINNGATVIDKTELEIIQARNKPNAIAARALIRAGTGHKYWSGFSKEMREKIEESSRTVYQLIHQPEIETPIKSLELPVAGGSYNPVAITLAFEFINHVNGLHPSMWQEGDSPAFR